MCVRLFFMSTLLTPIITIAFRNVKRYNYSNNNSIGNNVSFALSMIYNY